MCTKILFISLKYRTKLAVCLKRCRHITNLYKFCAQIKVVQSRRLKKQNCLFTVKNTSNYFDVIFIFKKWLVFFLVSEWVSSRNLLFCFITIRNVAYFDIKLSHCVQSLLEIWSRNSYLTIFSKTMKEKLKITAADVFLTWLSQ